MKQSEGSYRDEIIAKVLYMCSKEKYSLVTDFAWYTSVLLDLAAMQVCVCRCMRMSVCVCVCKCMFVIVRVRV